MIENFRLRKFDEHNFSIEKRISIKKEKSKGKRWKVVGYFPTLEMAAQRLLDNLLLAGEDSSSIKDLILEVRAARDHVSTLVLAQLTAGTVDANPAGVK